MSVEFGEAQIQLLAKGDQEAYRLLYKHFFVALCIFARNMGMDKEEAEDIVQEYFVIFTTKIVYRHIPMPSNLTYIQQSGTVA